MFFLMLNLSSVMGQSKYVPTGIRIGTNLKPMVATLTNDQIFNYEITGDINFHKYLLTVDLGQARLDRQGTNFTYLTNGTYFKGGVDINFFHNMEGNNALGLGMRYARSDFKNELAWRFSDALWGTNSINLKNESLSSQWIETLLMLKVDTWYNVQLGFTCGLKLANSVRGAGNLVVYEIPGYGYAEAASLWSFNYYVYYYIPLRR